MKPFRIFRPGKHRAACGTVVEFTEEDLKRAVAAYSPALYAAPLVIGHPKTEDRAYGWAESLTYEDGHVVVHPDKVNPEFSELVEQGVADAGHIQVTALSQWLEFIKQLRRVLKGEQARQPRP